MRPRRHLARLSTAFVALAVMAGAFAFPATPVKAWANGGGDGYGTHDWIVDQAVKVLNGRADSWFDASVARLASDDPDTQEPASLAVDHVYNGQGRRGGAIDRISYEFDQASASYARGDYHDASYHIGLLAHFYGDILQPFHTARAAIGKKTAHHKYELLVNDKTRHRGDAPSWASSRRTVSTFSNIRTEAIAAAAYSRKLFAPLYASFVKNESTLERHGQGHHRQGDAPRNRRPGGRDLVDLAGQGRGAGRRVAEALRQVGRRPLGLPAAGGVRHGQGRERAADRRAQGHRGLADDHRHSPRDPVHRRPWVPEAPRAGRDVPAASPLDRHRDDDRPRRGNDGDRMVGHHPGAPIGRQGLPDRGQRQDRGRRARW